MTYMEIGGTIYKDGHVLETGAEIAEAIDVLSHQPNVEAIVHYHHQAQYLARIEADRSLIHACNYLLKHDSFDLGDSAAITLLSAAISDDEEGEKESFLQLLDEQVGEKLESQ